MIHVSFKVSSPLSLPSATKHRVERELAEAVKEDDTTSEGGRREGEVEEEEEEVGSDSDSEAEGEGKGSGTVSAQSLQQSSSLEASMWSLDVSVASGMETSVYETEVSMYMYTCIYIVNTYDIKL